jgi:hypothetical protein
MHLLSLIEPVRATIVQTWLLTAPEPSDLMASVTEYLADPATVVVRQVHCQAWGRKPGNPG